jgi:hypothetical protein
MSFFKEPTWRSDPYMTWVRAQTCMGCGSWGIHHAHHNIAERYGSSKASDAWTLPLCPTCHTRLHADWPKWERENGAQDRHCLVILNRALVAGVLELNKRKLKELT